MRVPLAIMFGKSTSPLYDRAVRLAQGIAGYRRTGQGKELVHAVTVTVSLADETTWEKLHQLLRLVSAWRSASVHVAGQPVRYWALAGRLAQVKDLLRAQAPALRRCRLLLRQKYARCRSNILRLPLLQGSLPGGRRLGLPWRLLDPVWPPVAAARLLPGR